MHARILPLLFLLLLAGCEEPAPVPAPGELLDMEWIGTYTPEFFEQIVANFGLPYDIQLASTVTAYRIEYQTVGPTGDPQLASGALLVPADHDRMDVRSVQHGTEIKRSAVGSANPLFYGFEALMAAGRGYLVSAPDYLGLGSSDITQPYLHYQTTGRAVFDMLQTVYSIATDSSWSLSGRLFLSGYSGGGYATLAALKYMEEEEPGVFQPTAAAPMAGPYDMVLTTRSVLTATDYPSPALLALTVYTYDVTYDLGPLSRYFLAPYDARVAGLFDGQSDLAAVQEQLPADVEDLLEPSFINGILDGSATTILEILGENSLLDWTPEIPLRFFHGTVDQIVPYENSTRAVEAFRERGADVGLVSIVGGGHLDSAFPAMLLADAWFDSIRATN